ncbi:MAG: response regulator [Bacteroidota bacterium]
MSSHILVVDDEDVFRQMLVSSLKGDGYAVQSAADGERAIAMDLPNPFDLIPLDINMPPWMASVYSSMSRNTAPAST